jgi:hypothetical protein
VSLRLAAAHRAGKLDRTGVEQELFGERGLAGVWMRDDRERAAARDLRCQRVAAGDEVFRGWGTCNFQDTINPCGSGKWS